MVQRSEISAKMFQKPAFGSNDSVFKELASGTPIRYTPVVESEVVQKHNKEILVNIRLQCITAMKEYNHKSLEELRLEDLKAGRYIRERERERDLFIRPKAVMSSGSWKSSEVKSAFSFSLPAEAKPSVGFGQPAQVKLSQPVEAAPSPFFDQPAKTNLSFGFGKPAESKPFGKPLSESLSQPGEDTPSAFFSQLSFGFAKPAESKPSFSFGLPAGFKSQTENLNSVEDKPSFIFNQPAKTNLSFGFGKPAEDSLGEPEPKPAGGFGQPIKPNPFFWCLSQPTKAKPQILGSSPRQGNCSKQVTSLVYKCYACGLCFDRHEFMSKHFTNCVPFKKMTRIHCICGLEFDRHNYDYHCEVHRKSTELVEKIVTVDDDEVIDVGGMKEDFVEDDETDEALKENPIGHVNQEKVSAEHEFNINFVPADEQRTKSTDIFAAKVSTVYRCKCKLCFERSDFLFNHINNCAKKTTRILCVCGLEFDKHNYDYHCEIHRKYNMLRVKEVTVRSGETIQLVEMRKEFEEDEIKAVETTHVVQLLTDVNEPLAKGPAAEHAAKVTRTIQNLPGNKTVAALITTVIVKESEENIERSVKAKLGDSKINEVAEMRKSEANDNEMAIDDIVSNMTGATEEDKANDDQVTPDIAPDENIVPTKPEDKSISDSDSADREANDSETPIDDTANSITGATEEDKANDDQVTPDIAQDENTAPTKPENKAIGSSDSADGEANEITERITQFHINDDQENSEITDKNKVTDNPENGTNVVIEPIDQPNKENSENTRIENCAPIKEEINAIDSPEPLRFS